MNLDSFLSPKESPPTRERRSKSSKPRKSVRLSIFRKSESQGSKKAAQTQSDQNRQSISAPPGQLSKHLVPQQSPQTRPSAGQRKRSTKSVNLSERPPAEILAAARLQKFDSDPKLKYEIENDCIYKLRQLYREIETSYEELQTKKPFHTRVER